MAIAVCVICKGRAEANTYEEAADAIDHSRSSTPCPGGPGAKIAYINKDGSLTTTIPKKTIPKDTNVIIKNGDTFRTPKPSILKNKSGHKSKKKNK